MNQIKTHEDTLQVIREERKKSKSDWAFFILFVLMTIFWIILIGSTLLDLRKVEQPIYYFQCVEEYTATINGQSAKICEHNDGTLTTRVYYEYCHDVAVLAGMVEHCERKFFSIELK